jgi:hypothetical protein
VLDQDALAGLLAGRAVPRHRFSDPIIRKVQDLLRSGDDITVELTIELAIPEQAIADLPDSIECQLSAQPTFFLDLLKAL